MDKNQITDEYIISKIKEMNNKIQIPKSLSSVDKIIEKKQTTSLKFKNTPLRIAASFLLIIILAASPVLSQTFGNIFKAGFADKGLLKAQDNNQTTIIEKSIESSNIKLTLQGVVSDGIRTVLSIRLDSNSINLNALAQKELALSDSPLKLKGVSLTDSSGKEYQLHAYGQGDTDKDRKYFETTMEFEGSPSKETTFTLSISEINNIKGNWKLEFDSAPTSVKTYKATGHYDDSKITLDIYDVKFTSTYTILEGKATGTDFDIYSVLSNSSGETVEQLNFERVSDGSCKIYFPPISKSNEFNLAVKKFTDNNIIFSMKINVHD